MSFEIKNLTQVENKGLTREDCIQILEDEQNQICSLGVYGINHYAIIFQRDDIEGIVCMRKMYSNSRIELYMWLSANEKTLKELKVAFGSYIDGGLSDSYGTLFR